MTIDYWNNPVDVKLEGRANRRTITAACFASDCLLTLWPKSRGPAYFEALEACVDAMRGREDQNIARRAFIRAARATEELTT